MSVLASLADKLAHPLQEVRLRSLRSLRSKLDAGLVNPSELSCDPSLLRALLQLLGSSASVGVALDVLELLQRLAVEPSGARQLVGFGALDRLSHLQATSPPAEPVAILAKRLIERLVHLPSNAVEAASPSAAVPSPRTPPHFDVQSVSRPADPPPCSRALFLSASEQFPESTPFHMERPAARMLPAPTWTRLARVLLTRTDEQALFEAGVRLKMTEPAVLCDACAHVGGEIAHDIGAPAIFARPGMLEGLLSLIRTTEHAELNDLSVGALTALQQLVDRTTDGLKARLDTRLCHDATPESEEAPGWQVWELADATWSAATPLLRLREGSVHALPLLMGVLPLLYVPPHDAKTEHVDAAAALWRSYFEKLCAVLAFHQLLPKDGEPWENCMGFPDPLDTELLPLLLMAVATVDACPRSLLRLAAPKAIVVILRAIVASPYFAVCEAVVHNTAQEALGLLDPPAQRAAAAAAAIEDAAVRAVALCHMDSAPSTLGSNLQWARHRCAALRECLPALSYARLQTVPLAVVSLACLPIHDGELPEREELLASFLAHPVPSVREVTLQRVVSILNQHDSARSADGTGINAPSEDWAEQEARSVSLDFVDEETAKGSLTDALMEQRPLQILSEVALMVDVPPPPSSEAAVGFEHAKLAQTILMALIRTVPISRLAEFAPLLPLLQAFLPSPTHLKRNSAVKATEPPPMGSAHEASGAHACALLGAVLPHLPDHVRLAAQMRLLLHRNEAVAIEAAGGLVDSLLQPPLDGVPAAVLHGLPHDENGKARSKVPPPQALSSFDVSELRNLLLMVRSPVLEIPIRIAATKQLTLLVDDRTLLARALRAELLSTLVTTLEDLTVESSLMESSTSPLTAAMLHLFAAILSASGETRESVLSSLPALHLILDCAFAPAPSIRAATRSVFQSMLFDSGALAVAASCRRRPAASASIAPSSHGSLVGSTSSCIPDARALMEAAFDVNFCEDTLPLLLPRETAALARDTTIARTLECRRELRRRLRKQSSPDYIELVDHAGNAVDTAACLAASQHAVQGMMSNADMLERSVGIASACRAFDDCTNHASCHECLRTLHAVCAAYELQQLLRASHLPLEDHPLYDHLSHHGVPNVMQRLLTVVPACAEDNRLLAATLGLLERVLRKDASPEPQCASESSPPRLSTLEQLLFNSLTGVGAAVLELHGAHVWAATSLTLFPPASPTPLRRAVLCFGKVLIERFPELAEHLLHQGSCLLLICQHYANVAPRNESSRRRHVVSVSVPGGSDGTAPTQELRRLSLLLLQSTLRKVNAARLSAASVECLVEMVPTLIASAASHRDRGISRGVASQRAAVECLRHAVRLLATNNPNSIGRGCLWSQGLRWLERLVTDDDAHVCSSALEICARIARAGPLPAGELRGKLPELLAISARYVRNADRDTAYLVRSSALRLLLVICDAKNAEAPSAWSSVERVKEEEEDSFWAELRRTGLLQCLPCVIKESGADPIFLTLSLTLLDQLLHVAPDQMGAFWQTGADHWRGVLECLSLSHHWNGYMRSLAAAGVAEDEFASSLMTTKPLHAMGMVHATLWLRLTMPEVHRARAALLRLCCTLVDLGCSTRDACSPSYNSLGRELMRETALIQFVAATFSKRLGAPAATLRVRASEVNNQNVQGSGEGSPIRWIPPSAPAAPKWAGFGQLEAILLCSQNLQAARQAKAGAFDVMEEAVAFWIRALNTEPRARELLMSCFLPSCSTVEADDDAVPWVLSVANCLADDAPLRLRLKASRMLCVLFDGGLECDQSALELIIRKDTTRLEESPLPRRESASTHSADSSSGHAASTELASRLMALFPATLEKNHCGVPLVVGALRGLVAVSPSAKLQLLRAGFLPTIFKHIDDLRTKHLRPTWGPHDPTSTNGREQDAVPPLEQLIGCLSLVSNLLCACEEAKLACVSLQLPLLLLRLWPLGAAAPPLRTQLLRLLCNYVAHCTPAKSSLSAYSDSKERSISSILVRFVCQKPRPLKAPPNELHWILSWQILQSLATCTESRAVLYRSQLIAKSVPSLQRLLTSYEDVRARSILDFIANLTFAAEGQNAFLKMPNGFDTLLDVLDVRNGRLVRSRVAAALALRNLAFASDGKAAFLAKSRALPILFSSLRTADMRVAANAAAGLWALLSRCEKAKVALRDESLQQQLQLGERVIHSAIPRDPSIAALRDSALHALHVVRQLLGTTS